MILNKMRLETCIYISDSNQSTYLSKMIQMHTLYFNISILEYLCMITDMHTSTLAYNQVIKLRIRSIGNHLTEQLLSVGLLTLIVPVNTVLLTRSIWVNKKLLTGTV